MSQRSSSLQNRLRDIEQRLRAMRTVTNTASAEISGGETIIDRDGSLIFSDGGSLVLGGKTIATSDDRLLLDESGNLDVDTLMVYGDVLSVRDYLRQREAIHLTVVDDHTPESMTREVVLGFPDWASSAMVIFDIYLNTRTRSRGTNTMLVTLNGKPVARPRSDENGNVILRSTVVRRVTPDLPTIRVGVAMDEPTVPVADPRLSVEASGVFSA